MQGGLLCLFGAIAFFIIIGFLLTVFSNNLTQIQAKENFITCNYPDYNLGINNSTLQCSHVNHPNPYSQDKFAIWNITIQSCIFFSCGGNATQWVSTIPIGGITFLSDSITSVVGRFQDQIAIVNLVYVPASSIPNSNIIYLFLPYTVFLLMFAYGFFDQIIMRIVSAVRG